MSTRSKAGMHSIQRTGYMWPATAVLAADLVINVFFGSVGLLSFHLAVNTNHVIQMHVYPLELKLCVI